MINKNSMQTVKFIVIGSFVVAVAGIILSVLLRRDSPQIANICKIGGMILAILIFSGGTFWMIAGDTISKKLKIKKTPEQSEYEHKQMLAKYDLELEELKLKTELERERAKQQQMQNQIAMQKARINNINVSNKSNSGGSIDVLGNLSGFMTGKPQQQPIVKKKKKVVVNKPVPKKNDMDDFFIKF